MKYETIDGEKFNCELEALRHENDILTERLNNCREMCINDRVKEKHNKQYGCYGAAQRTVQAGSCMVGACMIIARVPGKAGYVKVDEVREVKVGMMVRMGTEWSQVTYIDDDVVTTTRVMRLHVSAIDEVLPVQKWLAEMGKALGMDVKLAIVPRED